MIASVAPVAAGDPRSVMGTAACALSLDDVAALLAVDPRLNGVVLEDAAWLEARQVGTRLEALRGLFTPIVTIPRDASDDRLYGGLDFAATLSRGRPVMQRGLLAAADGGVAIVPRADDIETRVRVALTNTLDTRTVRCERDGFEVEEPAELTLVLMSTGEESSSQIHPALADRVALRVPRSTARGRRWTEHDVERARATLAQIRVDDEWTSALCDAAMRSGIDSPRAVGFALRCARACAALDGDATVNERHIALAAELVLAHRATRVPMAPDAQESYATPADQPAPSPSDPPPSPSATSPDTPPVSEAEGPEMPPRPPDDPDATDRADDPPQDRPATAEEMAEIVCAILAASLPANLIGELSTSRRRPTRQDRGASGAGRNGALVDPARRGRRRGSRRGMPDGHSRLHLLDTLRAAAPWQRLRARERAGTAATPSPESELSATAGSQRLQIRPGDMRVHRMVGRTGTVVLFVVDASGSAAHQRLGDAKGAIEGLLLESYARRDHVALIAFRTTTAAELLPPTRALARARRVLSGLAGGGGTPLATALDAAAHTARRIVRAGSTPLVVLLTDARANIARDGTPGRGKAESDALSAAKRFAEERLATVLVDSSPRGERAAVSLAAAMGARYMRLPHGERALHDTIRHARQS